MSAAPILAAEETPAFDWRALIRETLDKTATADPGVIARIVAKQIPARHRVEVLGEVLRGEVRVAIHQQRRSTRHNLSGGPSRWKDAGDLYLKVLRQQEAISAEGEWKFLGDCTADDLLAIVDQRTAQAQANAAMAERYQRLHAAMTNHDGAKVVADLPQDVVLGALQ